MLMREPIAHAGDATTPRRIAANTVSTPSPTTRVVVADHSLMARELGQRYAVASALRSYRPPALDQCDECRRAYQARHRGTARAGTGVARHYCRTGNVDETATPRRCRQGAQRDQACGLR